MATYRLGVLVVVLMGVCDAGFGQLVGHGAVSGRVVDETGRPLGDVQVHLMQHSVAKASDASGRGSSTFSSHAAATSDAQGSFTLYLKDGASGVVFSNGDGDRVVDYALVESAAAVELKLKSRGRTLGGTVVDSEGQPVPNARVGLVAQTREEPGHRLGMGGAGMLRLTADADGKFQTDLAPALPVVVWAAMPDDAKALFAGYQYSAKKPDVDLGQGDVLDYRAVIDSPPTTGGLRLGGANARVEQNEGRVLIRKAD